MSCEGPLDCGAGSIACLDNECVVVAKAQSVGDAEGISLQIEGGITIAGTFYAAESTVAVILLHQLDADRSTWAGFAKRLQDNNINALAIDFRGHGKSQGDWQSFSKQDFNSIVLDVKAAKTYLSKLGMDKIFIIGASIGANTGLNYAATDSSIKGIVLLSPGLDYRGIATDKTILQYDRPLHIVVGTEDAYSMKSSRTLFDSSPSADKELRTFTTDKHGTALLNPDLEFALVQFVKEHI